MNEPFVSIIILNFNGLKFLKDCIDSVLNQTYKNYEIIFVDNASVDESVKFVQENYKSVKILSLDKNIGFAGGNNRGCEIAQGEYIVLLNNDTIVDSNWLVELVKEIQKPNVGVVSSFVKTEGIPEKYYEMNGTLNLVGHNIMRIFSDTTEIFYPNGASMIFRKDEFSPPFDEEYFIYSEDAYFGFRVRFKNKEVKQAINSKVIHLGSQTTKNFKNSFVTYYQERNRILNLLIFFSIKTILKLIPLFLLNATIKLLISLISRRYSLNGLIRAYTYLIFNFRRIRNKRKNLEKSVNFKNENLVLSKMTSKLTNGESKVEEIINKISYFYCKIFRIYTYEFRK